MGKFAKRHGRLVVVQSSFRLLESGSRDAWSPKETKSVSRSACFVFCVFGCVSVFLCFCVLCSCALVFLCSCVVEFWPRVGKHRGETARYGRASLDWRIAMARQSVHHRDCSSQATSFLSWIVDECNACVPVSHNALRCAPLAICNAHVRSIYPFVFRYFAKPACACRDTRSRANGNEGTNEITSWRNEGMTKNNNANLPLQMYCPLSWWSVACGVACGLLRLLGGSQVL